MRTAYRDIFLLACCQGLLLTNNSALISMNSLVGYALAPALASPWLWSHRRRARGIAGTGT